MTHTVTFRTLDQPDELILAGDQFKLQHQEDTEWHPCDLMVGHRLRDLTNSRVVVRRQIAHTPTPKEENVPSV